MRGRSTIGALLERRRVRVRNAASRVVEVGRCDGRALGGVDAEGDPGEQTVGQVITEVSELEHGVHAIGVSLGRQDAVVGVGGDGLGVVGVRVDGVGIVDQVLVKESLADVAGADVVAERAVLVHGDVGVDEDVDVGGTAGVVAREDGLEHGHTVLIGLLNTAEESLVDVGCVAGVAVAICHDT